MRRDLPSFSAMCAFEAAARHLSFRRAAEELNLTQSAISHQVKSLEAQLGVRLFLRQARRIRLSEAGKTYLADISGLLDQMAAATGRIRGSSIAGPLHVQCLPAFASRWLLPRLNDFNARHPDIELHISTSLEPADFAGDGMDVEIRFGATGGPDLKVEPFVSSRRCPLLSPDLLATGAPLGRPGDLANYVLLHEEVGDAWADWFAAAGARDVDTNPGPRFAHCDLELRAAVAGQGVALAFEVLAEREVAAGRLVRPFSIYLPATVMYSIVVPEAFAAQPKIEAFRRWLKAAAAQSMVHTRAA